jgi:hypothetical protein
VIHNASGDDTKGLEETTKLGKAREAMVNLKISHHEIIAQGEYALSTGIPASGNTTGGICGMDLFRIKVGRITDLRQNYDQLGMIQQMGAIPNP